MSDDEVRTKFGCVSLVSYRYSSCNSRIEDCQLSLHSCANMIILHDFIPVRTTWIIS